MLREEAIEKLIYARQNADDELDAEWCEALDMAIKALEKEPVLDKIKTDIAFAKRNIISENSEYLTGYISALSAVEGMIAQAESEDKT